MKAKKPIETHVFCNYGMNLSQCTKTTVFLGYFTLDKMKKVF